jgi:glycosyltransferase involved in cell wall biosynthesis
MTKHLCSSKQIWVVNPFDQIPNESDLPLRYWSLCRTFAEQGHKVIWWSSDFSHLHKIKREPCPETEGFLVRLIETPPYTKNISFARLKNHKAFADGFYRDAMAGLKRGELKAPDRIIVSLPPLGVAESAFRIRDFLRKAESGKLTTGKAAITSPCEVVVDIMDAWPEALYQALPKPLRNFLGPILLAPMHRSAKRAYQGADKISGVGQSYLDLAQRYLQSGSDTPVASDNTKKVTGVSLLQTPLHLCYHGTDLSRFDRDKSGDRGAFPQVSASSPQPTHNSTHTIQHSLNTPLRAVYLGAMGSGYDLQTIIDIAARWKAEDIFPFQIHFAGTGPQLEKLKVRCKELGLLTWKRHRCRVSENEPRDTGLSIARVVFHGFLKKDAINELLLSSDLALVPNQPDSLVACPYKAGEYAAAGLPMLSCLSGELGELLNHWNAGSGYNEGDASSLQTAFRSYSTDLNLIKQQRLNARKMAEALFDRGKSYQELSEFILIRSPQEAHSIVERIAPD